MGRQIASLGRQPQVKWKWTESERRSMENCIGKAHALGALLREPL